MRVVYGVEKAEHEQNVRVYEESLVLGKSRGNSELFKLACVPLSPALYLTHNYGYMPRLYLFTANKIALVEELLYLSCHYLGYKICLFLHKHGARI